MPMHYEATNQLTLRHFDPHSRQPSYKDCAVRIQPSSENVKSDPDEFTNEQKQYLSGFTFRCRRGACRQRSCPILSGSGGHQTEASLTLSRKSGASVDSVSRYLSVQNVLRWRLNRTRPPTRERDFARRSRPSRRRIHWTCGMKCRLGPMQNEFPKGTDVFLQKFHGLFHVAPAHRTAICVVCGIPGGVLHGMAGSRNRRTE